MSRFLIIFKAYKKYSNVIIRIIAHFACKALEHKVTIKISVTSSLKVRNTTSFIAGIFIHTYAYLYVHTCLSKYIHLAKFWQAATHQLALISLPGRISYAGWLPFGLEITLLMARSVFYRWAGRRGILDLFTDGRAGATTRTCHILRHT